MIGGRGPEFPQSAEPGDGFLRRPDFQNPGSREHQLVTENQTLRTDRLQQIRSELFQAGSIVSQDVRAAIVRGDFADIGNLVGNRLILPNDLATEVHSLGQAYAEGRGFVKPWYFVAGNPTALSYPGTARNRSTVTGIETLKDGKRIFLIDPKSTNLHRRSDTLLRHMSGNPARKVLEDEWKGVFIEKSRVPVLEAEDAQGETYPYGNIVALPFIPNVNGIDYFANNRTIDFPGEYEWAGKATVDDKVTVARSAMHELSVIHNEGKAWGEPAAHNMLIANEGKTVIIVDPEVLYDEKIALREAQARDVLDVTVSIAGAINTSGDIGGSDYQEFVRDIFSVYPDREVLAEAVRLALPLSHGQRLLYRLYEQKRMNNLPIAEYDQIISAIQTSPVL